MTKTNMFSRGAAKRLRTSGLYASASILPLLFASGPALAQNAPTPIPDVNVQAPPVPPDLSPADIGTASAASGGMYVPDQSFGPFGALPASDLPYSTNSVPQKIITDQQAKSLQDIVLNDPSVSIQQPANAVSNYGGPSFNIRGFPLDPSAQRIDGINVYGAPPPPELLERVDVLKGATTILYGFSAPGGIINSITKQPLNNDLTNFTLSSLLNNGQIEGAWDVSRRFGSDNQFGIRMNLAGEGGNGPVDNSHIDREVYSISMDWKPIEGMRIYTNDFYTFNYQKGIQPYLFLAFNSPSITHIPQTIDPTKALDQPYTYQKDAIRANAAGFEYDHNNWRAGVSYANSSNRNTENFSFAFVNDYGNFNVLPQLDQERVISNNAAAHLGHTFDFGGGFKDSLDVAFSYSHVVTSIPSVFANSPGTSSIYNPVYYADPVFPDFGPPGNTYGYVSRTTSIVDQLELGEHLALLGGFNNAYYNDLAGGFGQVTATESQVSTNPIAGIVFKPVSWVSLYGSYIEALELGAQAPMGTVNQGEFLPPYVGSQYEAGVKASPLDGLNLTLAGFRINQAYAFIDPTDDVYKSAGHQQNTGIEFTAAGKLTTDFTIFGGALVQAADVVDVGDEIVTGPGNLALGVPHVRLTFFGEYALPYIHGFTLMAGAVYNGKTPALVVNNDYLYISNYVTADIGAKYETAFEGHPITASFYVSNLANTRYWTSYGGGLIFDPGTPRVFKTSLSIRF